MFSEWEFRTRLKIRTTPRDDLNKVASHRVEALHGQAASVAQDLGTDVLASEEGPEKLLEALKKDAFPRMDREARELLREGPKVRVMLSRSNGDLMKAYT